MAKNKSPQKKQNSKSPAAKPKLSLNINLGDVKHIYVYISAALIAAVLPVFYLINASSVNGFFSFPLDDPWIHLTFAKNLSQYYSFSYFKNEIATSGSTSPIYTIILALLFFVSNNEYMISYFLGIVFFAAGAYFFTKISFKDLGDASLLAVLAVILFILDKWLNFISVSGMETTLFIFILLAALYFYKERHEIPFAIFLGLIIWCRPDGIAFIAALAIDQLIRNFFSKNDKSLILYTKQQYISILLIAVGMMVLYALFNYTLSGSFLPNTYNAKLTYYDPAFRSRSDFLKFEVWEYFTSGAYIIIMIGFLAGCLFILRDSFKKIYNPAVLYTLFCLILVFIYWYKLPYAHRFGRYLMPVIPFFILASMTGYKNLFLLVYNKISSAGFVKVMTYGIAAALIIMSIMNFMDNRKTYAEESKYIYDRQVSAALWLKNNTKEDDVIATHDVGAIGFYSSRKMIDVAGLITPELINKLNDRNYNEVMTAYLKQNGADYLVFLREWYRVVNQNPLFSTADKLPPEVMEIYIFTDSTYILPSDVKGMLMYAQDMLAQRQPQQALNVLLQARNTAPNSSLTYYLLAYAYSLNGNVKEFERNLLKAVEIFPDYKEALLQLGNYYRQINPAESQKYLKRYLLLNPSDTKARELLESIQTISPPDTLK